MKRRKVEPQPGGSLFWLAELYDRMRKNAEEKRRDPANITKEDLKAWVRIAGKMLEINQQSRLYVTLRIEHTLVTLYLHDDSEGRPHLGWWCSLSYYPYGRGNSASSMCFNRMHFKTSQEAVEAVCQEIDQTKKLTWG